MVEIRCLPCPNFKLTTTCCPFNVITCCCCCGWDWGLLCCSASFEISVLTWTKDPCSTLVVVLGDVFDEGDDEVDDTGDAKTEKENKPDWKTF